MYPPTRVPTHPPIKLLLDAGAELVGKTAMDELAYSLNGENAHYGTPVNPRCPDRVPGGSSSGSAVCVCGSVCVWLGILYVFVCGGGVCVWLGVCPVG